MPNLYQIQDPDRPLWVIANDWRDALAKWRVRIRAENEMKPEETCEPSGISLIAENDDLIP